EWQLHSAPTRRSPDLPVLQAVRERLAAATWNPEAIDAALRETAEVLSLGMGKVAQPLRVAITGTAVSPSIEHTVYLAGQEQALRGRKSTRLNSSHVKI